MVHVLYIDDDEGLGRLLKRVLASEGMTLEHAISSERGLALLASGRFDVVALDHNLISETGLDVIPRVQATADAPPIIYVTGSEDARIAVSALKAGAVDYVWKDVHGHFLELLGSAVGGALEGERLRRAQEEAILTNRTVEVAVSPRGYAFRVQRAGAWAPLQDGPFEPVAFGEGVSAAVSGAEGRSAVRFDPTGVAEPAQVRLSKGTRAVAVSVDGQGQVSIDAPG